jgi:hypothetical protein
MIQEERISAVQRLGYTHRQAAFLCLAALHGGYFLRRQCNTFFGLDTGGTAERLIRKALEKGHLHVHPSANQTLIYHVGNKPFIELIGEGDNRSRRWQQPYSVKIKLMGFDYVLAHPERRYLPTEQEKIDFFCGELALTRAILPARVYRSGSGHNTKTRYFVDKFPLFLSSGSGGPGPAVGFCYVDGNIRRPSGFDTYIAQYRGLWSQLPAVEVVYVSADRRMFPRAEGMFGRMLGTEDSIARIEHSTRVRLLKHFRVRDLLERRETRSLSLPALDQLREELKEFSGPEYASLYGRWKAEGDQVVIAAGQNDVPGKVYSFSVFELWHNYKLFGDLARGA